MNSEQRVNFVCIVIAGFALIMFLSLIGVAILQPPFIVTDIPPQPVGSSVWYSFTFGWLPANASNLSAMPYPYWETPNP